MDDDVTGTGSAEPQPTPPATPEALADSLRGLQEALTRIEQRLDAAASGPWPVVRTEPSEVSEAAPRSPLNDLAEHYMGAEFLLARADLVAPRDYRAAVELRVQAAEHVCAGLSAMIDSHELVAAISNRIDEAHQPEALPADRSRFVEIESTSLHLAGLPVDRARDLVHEAWYAYRTSRLARQ